MKMKIFCKGEPAARPYGGTFTVNVHGRFSATPENKSCL
jgi:hypothetical protein